MSLTSLTLLVLHANKLIILYCSLLYGVQDWITKFRSTYPNLLNWLPSPKVTHPLWSLSMAQLFTDFHYPPTKNTCRLSPHILSGVQLNPSPHLLWMQSGVSHPMKNFIHCLVSLHIFPLFPYPSWVSQEVSSFKSPTFSAEHTL